MRPRLARAAREPAVVVSLLVVGAHLALAALMPTRTSCLPVVPFAGVLVGAILLVGAVVVWMARRGASQVLRTQGHGRVPGRLRFAGYLPQWVPVVSMVWLTIVWARAPSGCGS